MLRILLPFLIFLLSEFHVSVAAVQSKRPSSLHGAIRSSSSYNKRSRPGQGWLPAITVHNLTYCPSAVSQPTRRRDNASRFYHAHCGPRLTPNTRKLHKRHHIYPFTSNEGEDQYAWRTFFPTLYAGTFLELGALDGDLYSNTRFFEYFRGWSGILIEANPLLFGKLCSVRKCAQRVSSVICDPNSVNSTALHFVQWMNKGHVYALVGGIWEFMPDAYRAKVYPDGLRSPGLRVDIVRCHSLQHILDAFGVTHVDFFSLDVEGAELSVLRTLNFTKVRVDVLVVELLGQDPAKDEETRELLRQSGFVLHIENRNSNSWYVHRSSPYVGLKFTGHAPAPIRPNEGIGTKVPGKV